MNTFKTISIAIYGDIEENTNSWIKWFEGSIKILSMLEIVPNYIGVIGESFKSGKILKLDRIEVRLRKSLAEGKNISALALYSLPKEFTQAAFDYDAYISRDTIGKHNHIILTLNEKNCKKLDVDKVIEELKNHINFKNGEIFEMYNTESPQFYAARAKSANACKTLDILNTF